MCDMQIVIIPLTRYIFTTSDGGENSADGAVCQLINSLAWMLYL